MADYYQLLGVARAATADEIRKAYRKKARESHPDANPDDPGAAERFKEISQAYETLKDPVKREAYDNPPAQHFDPGYGSGYQEVDLDELFQRAARRRTVFDDVSFSGGRSNRVRPIRGADIPVTAQLSFAEAFQGTRLAVKVNKPVVCDNCAGVGAEPPSRPVTCDLCRGSGQISRNEGFFTMAEVCPRCAGHGQVIDDPCHVCSGIGRHLKEFTYRLNVPPGVKNRSTLKLKGRGELGADGGPAGDVLVKIFITDMNGFERRGDDFIVDVPVSLADAALGAQTSVRVPEGGTVTVRIPRGSGEGKLLRVKGRGAPTKHGRGDLLARVRVTVPDKLTPEQEKALRAYQQASKA